METTEYGLRRTTTKAIIPKRFVTKEAAEEFLSKGRRSDIWEIVKRKVTYGEWEKEE